MVAVIFNFWWQEDPRPKFFACGVIIIYIFYQHNVQYYNTYNYTICYIHKVTISYSNVIVSTGVSLLHCLMIGSVRKNLPETIKSDNLNYLQFQSDLQIVYHFVLLYVSEMCSLTTEQVNQLIESCLDAKSFSYSPYSKFRVGCAILTMCGKVIKGCNVENVSYGLSVCAERTAYAKAVSDGYKSFKAVAISSDVEGSFTHPCGACRQFMSEFGDVEIIMVNNKRKYEVTTLSILLPNLFDNTALTNGQNNNTSA